ncbi:FAD-binding protein [Thermoleophilia bacterium SCSIO 60948]|nr:FAD-binding protein [Thermoleophilia bacterium SCSIO 60948]
MAPEGAFEGDPAVAASSELARTLGRALRGEVRDDAYTRHLFAADASMYAREPLAVCFPRDTEDVAAAIEIAGRFDVPVVPRGGGTSLAGQAVGGSGVVLDTSRHMNRILDLDPVARRVRLEPGVVQEDLNRAAHRHGLGFGPDTSTSNRATLGGMIANNSSGSQSIVHGTTVDHVFEIEAVLSDGSSATFGPVGEAERERLAAARTLEGAIHRGLPSILAAHAGAIAGDFPRHWRQSGGYRLDRLATEYDLAKLVTGSEGTLVAITEATVGLVELPRAAMFAVGHFDSVDAAIAATGDAIELGASSIELIDGTILDLARSKLEYRALTDLLAGEPQALLYAAFWGADADECRAKLDALEDRWASHGHGYHVLRAETAGDQEALTRVRKAGLGLLMAAGDGATRPAAFVEDTAVAPDRLGEYIARFREILAAANLNAGFYGHASVGCLHVRPFIDLTQPGAPATMSSVAAQVAELVAEFGGVNASEHGDGRVRTPFSREVFGDELYEAMREVKRLFDPEGRMNPGVMVDPALVTADLRDPALPPPGPIDTHFDFGAGGMRGAADSCQRIGVCRKTGSGVMCPSYMATREEEHATRGRANALVKALSEPDPAAAMGDERLHEILDLCLECKACKSECPLSVDMATMKSEFLAHYQAEHGVPARSRLFGSIRALNRIGAATAPLSNLPMRVPAARALLERRAGIARERPLPRFERRHLIRWDRRRARRDANAAPRGDVVFLADSFTTFTEPAIGRATIELLEAAGHRVRLESAGCCGRASISKGLLDDAREKAEAMVARLAPEAERGVPIVGCEPSCVLTLGEEHPALLPGDERAAAVGRQARLVEGLLVEAIEDGALVLDPRSPVSNRTIVFHGHCHQKALVGTDETVALLERIPGARVEVLDAGCCGMAGSFGFEAEHYDLSMQIGESRLFPALRDAPEDALVAATGVSCRQQIAHGTERRAAHPVELVRAALG